MAQPESFGPFEAGSIVGLFAEPDRLRVFAAVALGATTPEAAAKTAGVDAKAAVVALERLAGTGVVVQGEAGLEVNLAAFKDAARAAAQERKREADMFDALAGVPAEAAAVLRNFVHRGRLTSIPAHHSKRLVVLDWLASKFEPGTSYPEEQVNLMLGMIHADTAALRRYLVDEGFLERRDRLYWRAGGTVDI